MVQKPIYGPGFHRMATRMGPERQEALRQQVLKEQVVALKEASEARPISERERDTYQDYPPVKPKSKRRK